MVELPELGHVRWLSFALWDFLFFLASSNADNAGFKLSRRE